MKVEYILIDYENIQPKDLELVRGGKYQVRVFVGPHQSKILVSVVTAVQELGPNGGYIVVEKGGRNALDFFIAYYLGELACKEPDAGFYIISKDTGFDPLIEHLKGRGVTVRRVQSAAEITSAASERKSKAALIEEAIEHLLGMKQAQPRTRKRLLSTLRSRFKLEEKEATELVEELCRRELVSEKDGKMAYRLPEG